MFESEAELAYPVTLGLDARKERRHLEHQVEQNSDALPHLAERQVGVKEPPS